MFGIASDALDLEYVGNNILSNNLESHVRKGYVTKTLYPRRIPNMEN